MLLKRKNSPFWYAVLRVGGKQTWTSTKCASKKDAQAFHDEIRLRLQNQRRRSILARLTGEPTQEPHPLKISLAWAQNAKINPNAGDSARKQFAKFEKWYIRTCGDTDISLITRDTAIRYLDTYKKQSAKTSNNAKAALSNVWKTILPYTDAKLNIWHEIPNRSLIDVVPFRPFSDGEVNALLKKSTGFWHSAILIAYYTGLRQKDIRCLRWTQISADSIELVPAKTVRLKKSVYIPIHPELKKLFSELKNDSEYVFPAYSKNSSDCYFETSFSELLEKCKITDNKHGRASFHSLRTTFITRCEEAGIPRSVIQGIVGHGSPVMTEHYSHDRLSARAITALKPPKTQKKVGKC